MGITLVRRTKVKAIKKFHQQSFDAYMTAKDNYLQAMKWLGKNVIGKIDDVTFEIIKGENGAIELTIYAVLDDAKLNQQRCKSCKEFHQSFFITSKNDCDRCYQKAFRADVKSTLTVIAAAKKGRIK